jgi:hypothetical protein
MPTAQELIDISTKLTAVVASIDTIIGNQPLPLDADAAALSDAGTTIAARANVIGQAGLDALANDVKTSVTQLTAQVSNANAALQHINDLTEALNIASAVLAAAAGIASSVATGNWVGAAGDVFTLANKIQTAVKANQPQACGAVGP